MSDKILKKYEKTIEESNFISRDLSWLAFNERVLDQVHIRYRTLAEKLKFLSISSSNLDEFFTIRVGSLYNYLDYNKPRMDYCGLPADSFRKVLLATAQSFYENLSTLYFEQIKPTFEKNDCQIIEKLEDLSSDELQKIENYFHRVIFPMLTPMVVNPTLLFSSILSKALALGILTSEASKEELTLSFVQIPQNLPRFYTIEKYRESEKEEKESFYYYVPIELIIKKFIYTLYRNIKVQSVTLFRLTRNGDFDMVDFEDSDTSFINEIKQKLNSRRIGRVTRLEIEENPPEALLSALFKRFQIDEYNVFINKSLIDFTNFQELLKFPHLAIQIPPLHSPVLPLGIQSHEENLFDILKHKDILLHHPYHSFEHILTLLEQAADDPEVLLIKITLYRIARNSRIIKALLRAAENKKQVSVLFEVKARFDEERNIKEGQNLQKANCLVVYGVPKLKTHSKIFQIIRNENGKINTYTHLSSGNYNEETSQYYTDISLLTSDAEYAEDVTEFFNAITGHSHPMEYKNLITSPTESRKKLIDLIRSEAENAEKQLPNGIIIKINSLQDKKVIEELYKASQKGVKIQLIVRGICCLRPQRKNVSETIEVRSIVGDFLEHARLYYFHNQGEPEILCGSADIMVRSFDKRVECLFKIKDSFAQKQALYILKQNLLDTTNAYLLRENGTYEKIKNSEDYNIHEHFYHVPTEKELDEVELI